MMPNVDSVFRIPEVIAESPLMKHLNWFTGSKEAPDLRKWTELVARQQAKKSRVVKVGMVAKYLDNEDTYISVLEALKAAAWQENVELDLTWINAEKISHDALDAVDAVVVPGGFGQRGIEGKIAAANYALEHKKPYLGLCLGLQVAVVAAARRAGLSDANSSEFDPETIHDVVYIMEGQAGKESTGGTLRLGDYPAILKPESLAARTYGATDIVERHRHRYEVNQKFTNEIEQGGLVISGTSPDGKLVEFVEATDHPYFLATQAHPEFKSRPFEPHPLFLGLLRSIA